MPAFMHTPCACVVKLAPLAYAEHEHSRVGVVTVVLYAPHVIWHFFAVFLHFFFFDGHAAVLHRPFAAFLTHFFVFHLSAPAASDRFTHAAATRATSSAPRISPEESPASEWRRQK